MQIEFIHVFKDEATLVAEQALNELRRDVHIFVDDVVPGRITFNDVIRRYNIQSLPAIIVTVEGVKTVKIEGEEYYKDKEKLKDTLTKVFFQLSKGYGEI
jgi:hypothetical protein